MAIQEIEILRSRFGGYIEVSEELGITGRHLFNLRKGMEPGPSLRKLIDLLIAAIPENERIILPSPKLNSLTQEAHDLGVSRQCIWQRQNPEKTKVSHLAKYHTDKLNILYECPCNGNGNREKHNHHFDYSRPFEVIRLCAACHAAEHARIRALHKNGTEALA